MNKVEPKLAKCLKHEEEEHKIYESTGEECYHPGRSQWCSQYHGAINNCVAMSYGCFFKFRCQNPCVCTEWKKENCGGTFEDYEAGTSPRLWGDFTEVCAYGHREQKNHFLIAENMSSRRDKIADGGSLDTSLADKCVAR